MKTILLAGLVLASLSLSVSAQTTSESGSTSQSTASASPHQAQQAQAQAVYAPTVNETAQPTRTTAVIKNTPDLVAGAYAPSMSSDSCMVTAQVGVAVAGVGATAGKGVPDDTCRKLRAAEKHLQIVNAAHVLGRDDVALYQLMLSATDACVADGFPLADCQKTAQASIYPTKH